MSLRRITVLDTACASTNLGDQIIMDAIRTEIAEIFPDAFAHSVASHEYMGAKSRGLIARGELAIASGTNLLSSRMWARAPWKLFPWDGLAVRDVVLMGCGWYQYQRSPDPYSRWLLRSVLSGRHIHAVRDSYSLQNLRRIGITNVVNTSCPTLWHLDAVHCAGLPRHRAREVVATLNTYIRDVEADRRLLEILARHYETVHLWVQTDSDWDYALGLMPGLSMVGPSLCAYDALLEGTRDLDYVGNRLHGGIRALQKCRRAIIVEVDNRAAEMGRDFALPTVGRTEFDRLEAMIEGPLEIAVSPPAEAIAAWKGQFAR